jgi:hypothetical protein
MIRRIPSKFVLEVFDGKLSNPKQLAGYLKIYLENIAPENRTDTNELIGFLETPLNDRRIIYFGLKYAGVPCGFASLMFYPREAIAIADHVAIDARVRGIGAFFALVDQISNYLDEVGIVPDYVVAEIMRRSQSLQGEINPIHLIRLLRVIGFRVLKIPYVAPHSGITEHADRYQSALMVIPRQPINDIPAEACKSLVELIYYGHYLKWYTRVWPPAETAAYKTALDKCFEAVKRQIAATPFVRLNGAVVPTDETFPGQDVGTHARNYTYAALFLTPIVLTMAVSLAQELWLAAAAVGLSLFVLLVVFLKASWRLALMKLFRPE